MGDKQSHLAPGAPSLVSTDADFKRFFEALPDRHLIIAADAPRYTIVAATDRYLDLVNLDHAAIVGRGLFEVFPEIPAQAETREQSQLRKAIDSVSSTSKPRLLAAYRYDLEDPNGTGEPAERYWSPMVSPIFDADGTMSAILLTVEEATDFILRERFRRPSLDAAKERGERPRAVLVIEPNAILRDTLSSTLETFWSVVCATTAAEARERLRTYHPDVILMAMSLPDDPASQLIADIKSMSQASVIARIDHTDGRQYREALDAGADDVIAAPTSMREVLARIQTQLVEADLREATQQQVRRQYHQVLMQAPIAIALMEGPDKVYTMSNPAHDEMVGHRALIGKPLREAFHEPELQPLFDRLDEVYATGEPYFAHEVPVTARADGQISYVTFAYLPFITPSGATAGVTSFAYDVTEQVEMRQAVEQESRRKDVFLAMLGHELRNPLAPIAHANALLRLDPERLSADQIRWASDTIARQIDQLERHVNDLLDVARINQGRITVERRPVELQSLLDRALEAAVPRIDARRQHLSVSSPHRRYVVDVDDARIVQVVTNLLDNASKYSPPGGRIRLEASIVDEPESTRLILEVQDEGEGIDPEFLPQLFHLFTQDNVSLDRSRGGLGLGLALVKGIIEMHAGTIEARSAGRDQGSTFTVELPVKLSDVKSVESTSAPRKLSEARILVVDDMPDVAEALKRLLESLGATVLIAEDGARALELVPTLKPTHILLDIGLPDLDGYEVARRLRDMPDGQAATLIALTGYGLPEDSRRAIDAGFDHHLTKPARIDRLIDLLSRPPRSAPRD
jgi:PAS domain S-box-containing protein